MLGRLDGEVVVITGRPRFATKKDLEALIRTEGAHVSRTLNANASLLLVCEGKHAAKLKQAKTLNEKGAGIAIVDESTLGNRLHPNPKQLAQLLADAGGRRHLGRLVTVLGGFEVEDAKLRGLALGRDTPTFWRLARVDLRDSTIEGCHLSCPESTDFRGATITGGSIEGASDCDFRKATLTDVDVGDATGCDFRGAALETQFRGGLARCKLSKVVIEEADFGLIADCDFDGASLLECGLFGVRSSSFVGADLRGVESFADSEFVDTAFRRTSFADADLDKPRFERCDLRRASFRGATLQEPVFIDCELSGADFTDASVIEPSFEGCDEGRAKGLQTIVALELGRQLKALDAAAKKAREIHFDIDVCVGKRKGAIEAWSMTGWGAVRVRTHDLWGDLVRASTFGKTLMAFAAKHPKTKLDLTTLKVRSKKSPVKGKALKELVESALHEAFGTKPPTATEQKAATRARRAAADAVAARREAIIVELRAGDVAAFHRRSRSEVLEAGSFAGIDFSGCDLSGIDLNKLDLRGANFDGADLEDADLAHARLEGSSFVKANLDLADLDGASVDDTTVFPKGYALSVHADWRGKGPHPGQLASVTAAFSAKAAQDVLGLLEHLHESVDHSRLKKALAMLKADRFELFSEVGDDEVIGLVKSQSTDSRIYATRLGEDGSFSCCTQNLRPCGGLRGAVCKHLLVMTIGLVQAGAWVASEADLWVAKSGVQSPVFDKEAMRDVFLRYQNALAGSVDWRPTETVPEDFYAY